MKYIILLSVCFALALLSEGKNEPVEKISSLDLLKDEINELRSQMKDVDSRIHDLKNENDKVKSQVKDLKTENDELKYEIKVLKIEKHEQEHNVIFSAYKNDSGNFYAGDYLEGFNGFLINFGNGFTLSNGRFTAQRNGNYDFSVAAYHYFERSSDLTVEHNGAQVLIFRSFDDADAEDTLSFSWIMELKQGDVVRIKVTNGLFYCGTINYCIFSGKYI